MNEIDTFIAFPDPMLGMFLWCAALTHIYNPEPYQ